MTAALATRGDSEATTAAPANECVNGHPVLPSTHPQALFSGPSPADRLTDGIPSPQWQCGCALLVAGLTGPPNFILLHTYILYLASPCHYNFEHRNFV